MTEHLFYFLADDLIGNGMCSTFKRRRSSIVLARRNGSSIRAKMSANLRNGTAQIVVTNVDSPHRTRIYSFRFTTADTHSLRQRTAMELETIFRRSGLSITDRVSPYR